MRRPTTVRMTVGAAQAAPIRPDVSNNVAFDEDVVRFIRMFCNDVRKDVWAELVTATPEEAWDICAEIDGKVSRYRLPAGQTIGDAFRMFPELAKAFA